MAKFKSHKRPHETKKKNRCSVFVRLLFRAKERERYINEIIDKEEHVVEP